MLDAVTQGVALGWYVCGPLALNGSGAYVFLLHRDAFHFTLMRMGAEKTVIGVSLSRNFPFVCARKWIV